jgi:hypothetical protein
VPRSSECSPPFRFSDYIFSISHISHTCYMTHPSHPPWFDHPNIWWSIQVMELLIMQFSPAVCHFLCFKSKYSSQHPVNKHPQSVFFP